MDHVRVKTDGHSPLILGPNLGNGADCKATNFSFIRHCPLSPFPGPKLARYMADNNGVRCVAPPDTGASIRHTEQRDRPFPGGKLQDSFALAEERPPTRKWAMPSGE